MADTFADALRLMEGSSLLCFNVWGRKMVWVQEAMWEFTSLIRSYCRQLYQCLERNSPADFKALGRVRWSSLVNFLQEAHLRIPESWIICIKIPVFCRLDRQCDLRNHLVSSLLIESTTQRTSFNNTLLQRHDLLRDGINTQVSIKIKIPKANF